MRKDPRVYLAQILERIERIVSYTESGKESFLGNPIVQDAVIRNLEVMGEAAKRIPDDYKASLPIIRWRWAGWSSRCSEFINMKG
ncbi:MAG: HepT-like ribonuclease domain-containing protein [Thermodesulfobacteriota bacterium]